MKNFFPILLIVTFFILAIKKSDAQTDTVKLLIERIDELTNELNTSIKKTINIGISVGYRKVFSDQMHNFQTFSISPNDYILHLDYNARDAYVISSSILIYPFMNNAELINSKHLAKEKKEAYQKEFSFAEKRIPNIKRKIGELHDMKDNHINFINDSINHLRRELTSIRQVRKTSKERGEEYQKDFSFDEKRILNIQRKISELSDMKDKNTTLNDSLNHLRRDLASIRQIRKTSSRYAMKNQLIELIRHIGLSANINLADFNQNQSEFVFNKNIEGGTGLTLQLTRNVHLGYNNDLLFTRQLRQHIKTLEGQSLFINDQLITSSKELDFNDDNIFITKNIISSSLKFIVTF